MPAGLIPALIIGGASAGAQVAGAKMASGASKKAAQTQQAGAERALDLQKQLYTDAQARFSPYQSMAAGSLERLPQIAGNVPYAAYGQSLSGLSQYGQGQPPRPVGASQTPMAASQGPMGQPDGGPMVTILAPTGQTKQVPASEAPHWVSRGGRVVR